MTMVTVAVVGGGSSMFVPGLVRRMLELDAFEDAELRLMDIDSARLQVMSELATELASAEGRKLSVAGTTNQREALQNVDFAIVAISVGGMAAWESDIEVPGKHGVFMHIADSIGPGGIFRALRNMPGRSLGGARPGGRIAPGDAVQLYKSRQRQRHGHG